MKDRSRLLRVLILVVWAGFFFYLWISGESTKFIGPRTAWVVPFGAIVLGLTTLAHVATRGHESRVRVGEALGALVLITPILALLVIPDAGLGALAASRKSNGGGIAALTSVLPSEDPDHEISFADIEWANESKEFAVVAGIDEGLELTLVGFVTHPPDGPEGSFDLTRFYIACCAADVVPRSVTVSTPSDFNDDTWLRVEGHLERLNDVFVLVPDAVHEVEEPDDPYLY